VRVEARFFGLPSVFFLSHPVWAMSTMFLPQDVRADPPAGLIAVEQRHPDVEQHDVGAESFGDVDGLDAVVRGPGLMSVEPEQEGKGIRASRPSSTTRIL
jgi:hypothetical protein